jgi:catechol 2,3-dioxygenase-like lactoylglutathione lyase family enzyme
MQHHLRVARPVTDLTRSVAMYCAGLGFQVLGSFEDHEGFDGVMLGSPGMQYHFEFTCFRDHAVRPTPTVDDLAVFYIADEAAWQAACANMLDAGFTQVPSFNPYWNLKGRTFEDADGYRTVLQNAPWNVAAEAAS